MKGFALCISNALKTTYATVLLYCRFTSKKAIDMNKRKYFSEKFQIFIKNNHQSTFFNFFFKFEYGIPFISKPSDILCPTKKKMIN